MKIEKRIANRIGHLKESSSASDRAALPEKRANQWRRLKYVLAVALMGIGCLTGAVYLRNTKPLLPVPVPADLIRLEPQLREYVQEKVKWVKAAPRDARRHATLGLVYAANSLWPEARRAFQNAAQLNPKEPLAQLYVAVSTQESGDFADALKLYRQLTIQFPDFAPAFDRLGDALLRAGAVDEAEQVFKRLIFLAPAEWRGYAGLGDVKIRKGEHVEAVEQLDRAIRLEPGAKRAHHLLGLAYRAMGRIEDAQRELSLGLGAINFPMPDAWAKEAPRHMKLLQDQFQMADEYSAAGQVEKAVQILEKALTYHPNNLTVMNHLGIAYNRAGQFEKARALLLRVVQIDERHLPAHIALSYSCVGLGLHPEALSHAARAIELAPNVAQTHLAEANVLLALEHDTQALAALESALRCDPQNSHIHLEIGDVAWRNLDRPEEALEHYKKATVLDPSLGLAFAKLAEVSISLGQANVARDAIQSLRKLSPADPAVAALENELRRVAKP